MPWFGKSGGRGYQDNTRDTTAAARGEGKHRDSQGRSGTSSEHRDGKHAQQGGKHRRGQ